MSPQSEIRCYLRSNIAVAAFFLFTAVSIACEFWYIWPIFDLSTTMDRFLAGVIALVSPVAFLCACVLVFFRPHPAYRLGLSAGLMGLPWFILAERSSPISSWIIFNMELERRGIARVFAILSVALIVVSSVWAIARLLPNRWTFRRRPVGQRTWPAIFAGLLVLGIWLYHAGTPYQIPMIADEVAPEFRILHIEKRGLLFRETVIHAYRNGEVFLSRSERNLFQYKFDVRVYRGVMPHKQIEAFKNSVELLTQRRAPTPMLHSWNAEGWYVVGESKILAFTTDNKLKPPQLVVDRFTEIEKQPMVAMRTAISRDVCFGFCYGPLAALGFQYMNSFGRYAFLTP